MKVFARQVAPEYQESPFFTQDEHWQGIVLAGNTDLRGRVTAAYDNLISSLDQAASELRYYHSLYRSLPDFIMSYFPPEFRDFYTPYELNQWKTLLENHWNSNSYSDLYDTICEGLTLITGCPYAYRTLRGSVQGEWQYVFYPKNKYSDKDIRQLEIEYFNLGSEWIIHDGDDIPQEPDDIKGYSIYCYSEDIRKEIAESAGVKPEDVVLYEFDRFDRIAHQPVYRLAQ